MAVRIIPVKRRRNRRTLPAVRYVYINELFISIILHIFDGRKLVRLGSYEMQALNWLFSIPMPLVAMVSAAVALSAYLYQRNEKRKQKAYEVAAAYANHLIPRFRIIGYILEEIGMKEHTRKFTDMMRFDNSELNKYLQDWGKTNLDFYDLMKKIDRDIIERSVAKAGYNIIDYWGYTLISGQAQEHRPDIYRIGFEKMVINFLNELESMAMLFRYNIADEKIVYQSMHQSYLGHMSNWYYFISYDNYTNECRYYDNLIWLYHKWNCRKSKRSRRFKRWAYSYKGRKL